MCTIVQSGADETIEMCILKFTVTSGYLHMNILYQGACFLMSFLHEVSYGQKLNKKAKMALDRSQDPSTHPSGNLDKHSDQVSRQVSQKFDH
jgi:hypothetical protein